MSYDHWKTTNPDDEWLGPDPAEEDRDEPEDQDEPLDGEHSPCAHPAARKLRQ